jgi:hypothetical protein
MLTRIGVWVWRLMKLGVALGAIAAVREVGNNAVYHFSGPESSPSNWVLVRQLESGIQVLDTSTGRLCFILNDPKLFAPDCSRTAVTK